MVGSNDRKPSPTDVITRFGRELWRLRRMVDMDGEYVYEPDEHDLAIPIERRRRYRSC